MVPILKHQSILSIFRGLQINFVTVGQMVTL